MRYLPLITVMLLLVTLPAFGASSYLGPSGLIATPDDLVLPGGTWELGFHQFVEVFGDTDFNVLSINYGLAPNLEVGVAFSRNGEDDTYFNGKLRLVEETPTRPSILVGAMDIGGTVGVFGGDPTLYVVASKNLTPMVADAVGQPANPIRLNFGFGSGLYDGVFAGVDWTIGPQTRLLFEYVNNDIGTEGSGGSNFNAGIRYSISDTIRVDAAVIDLEDLAFGASLRTAF